MTTIAPRLRGRRRERPPERELEALLDGAFAGAVVAVFAGVADLSMLSRSQVPFDGPIAIARVCVTASAGAGFVPVAAAVAPGGAR